MHGLTKGYGSIGPKARTGRFCITALVLWAFFTACSADDSSIKDGYYTAEAAEFDAHGWKEYVTICVSGGRIIFIEYNAFDPTGFVKSWDMNYMRVMNALHNTYPNAYTRYYGKQFLSSQGTGEIIPLSGASRSYESFIRLADAALENARQGNVETRLVQFNDDENNTR